MMNDERMTTEFYKESGTPCDDIAALSTSGCVIGVLPSMFYLIPFSQEVSSRVKIL